MNTRSSILTAALLCLGALASVPTASAQFPPDVPSTAGCEAGLGEETPDPLPCVGMLTSLVTAVVTCMTTDPPSCIVGALPPVHDEPSQACVGPAAADDAAHDLLCVVTVNLPTALFEVEYADSDDLYPGTSSDNDGRTDYAVIHVLDPAGGDDPVLTVNLLIDLQRGTSPATPADGPLVSVLWPGGLERHQDGPPQLQAVPSITIDLGEVHLQDPRHGQLFSDLDDDGYSDAEEATCLGSVLSKQSTCDDVDGDGMDKAWEENAGTSPHDRDTDGDGHWDGDDEDPLVPEEDPVEPPTDTDNDGVPDSTDNCDTVANPTQANMDEERPANLLLGDDEADGGGGDACDDDIDGDGLSNEAEEDHAETPTNPLDADTDGDGFEDGDELALRSDPTDDESTPTSGLGANPLENFLNPLEILTNPDCDAATVTSDGDCRTNGPLPRLLDRADPHDIDDDGVTNEQNGQVDLVENLLAYVDPDERGEPTHVEREKNADLEGDSGYTVVVWDPALLNKEKLRLHVTNGGRSDPSEVAVLEQGPRNSPSSVTCVYTEGGQPSVVVAGGGYYDGTLTSRPCGQPFGAVSQLNAVGALLGDVVFNVMAGPEEPLPLFVITDANSDGVPDFVTLNLPDPVSCTPDAEGCTEYADPLVLPPGGVDPNDLCGATGTFPGCLVPSNECAEEPESCLPPPPPVCDPTVDPTECAPTPEDPLAGVIPACTAEVMAQPAYVCRPSSGPSPLTPLGRLKVKAGPAGPFYL